MQQLVTPNIISLLQCLILKSLSLSALEEHIDGNVQILFIKCLY